ncbi:MAG: hypothetical protein LBE59_10780 [Nevskiaceae bacterium]|nr:hypothetical protein [Nevskiaceae bacterium]
MAGALVYLQAIWLYNNFRLRLLRLRQPKYLIGALVFGVYLYFFLLRRMKWSGAAASGSLTVTPALAMDFTWLAAVALLLMLLAEWLFSGDRARLAFSEAEIAFLFPAPLTRTALIQFNLLRSQLGIFFSAFLVGLLLRRGSALGGNPLQYAVGLWLMLSTLKLHAVAASFTRERLSVLGLRAWSRRALIVAIVVSFAFVCVWSMRGKTSWPIIGADPDIAALRLWFEAVVSAAPLSWVLAPLRWLAAPMFARGGGEFARALFPALLLLALHYVWAVRVQASFEDASIAHARRRAEKVAAMREGRMRQRAPTRPREEPFALAARGYPPLAFLWKGLIAAGPLYRLRHWLMACVVVTVLSQWLAADPARRAMLAPVGATLAIIGVWLVLLGPMLFQHSLRRAFERLDVLKAMPLRGWQIAGGELSAPAVIMSLGLWLVLLLGAQAVLAGNVNPDAGMGLLRADHVIAIAAGLAWLAPPLCGLMLCLPFAGMLYFPAWTVALGVTGVQGVEVMGQRMLFMLAYFVAVALLMLPAAIAGGAGLLLANWAIGPLAAIAASALSASAVLGLELFLVLRALGRRIDGFDLSQELR